MANHQIIHKNICGICGKEFRPKYKKQKYCSKRCSNAAVSERWKEDEQICWRCENAYCNCSWSKKLIPVPGWTAEKVTVDDSEGKFKTYKIISCPLFKEEVRK